jgi:predicted HAD superfamily Cof-like phosphohydrolase
MISEETMTVARTNPVEDCLLFFQKAKPEPTTKDIHTQFGVHFEEVAEMIDAMTPLNEVAAEAMNDAYIALERLATYLKENDEAVIVLAENRLDFADALCDQMVTAIGSAHVENIEIVGAFDEVNESNLSKFDDDGNPIFDANRKVTKGPNYRKADLTGFV